MAELRKYFVKQSWIFNLESVQDKLACIGYDIEEGALDFPLELAGRTISDWDDLEKLKQDAERLEWTAKSGRVTGKEYGEIKKIVEWRVGVRYATCVAAGMDERRAGGCFEDL